MAKWEMVQSVIKVADILETVADSETGMRLNEISEKLNIKNTTVHNLVRTLVAKGFLDKNAKNCYTLGQGLEDLVNRQMSRKIFSKAEDELQRLAEKIPDAVMVITEIAYSEIVVRMRISPDRPGTIQRPANQTFFPYSSVTGLLFLALAEKDLDSILLRYPFTEYGSHLWKTEENLTKYLSTVKKKGYSTGDLMKDTGFRVAVPIRGKYSEMQFALGVTIKEKNVTTERRDEIIELVLETGKHLSNNN